MKVTEAKRLKELEQKNPRLKQLHIDEEHDKVILKEHAKRNI